MSDANWILKQVVGKEESNQASGCKFTLEEEAQKRLLFGSLEQGRHGEQFGKLELSSGSKPLFAGEGKLTRTDYDPRRKKKGKSKASRSSYTFVPTSRLDPKHFGQMFGAIGTTLSATFTVLAESGDGLGDGRPEVETVEIDDPNVVPGSAADHMKKNAKRELATAK